MSYDPRFLDYLSVARDIALETAACKPADPEFPPLFFFTDPRRTPLPEAICARLPPGCGVIYRHFGQDGAETRARELRRIAADNGLILLIGEDEDLADKVGADGLHLREASLDRADGLRARHPDWKLTAASHGPATLMNAPACLSALFISPVFASASPSAAGVTPLGTSGAAKMASLTTRPVYGLGGIGAHNLTQLRGHGLSGLGAVDLFLGGAGD